MREKGRTRSGLNQKEKFVQCKCLKQWGPIQLLLQRIFVPKVHQLSIYVLGQSVASSLSSLIRLAYRKIQRLNPWVELDFDLWLLGIVVRAEAVTKQTPHANLTDSSLLCYKLSRSLVR